MPLPREFAQEMVERACKPAPSITFTIPKDHPAADTLVELMGFLATEMRMGAHSARRPGSEDGVDVMLDALRRAGYAQEVDGALLKIDAHLKNDAVTKGMSVLGVLLHAPGLRETAKHAEEHLFERVPEQMERDQELEEDA